MIILTKDQILLMHDQLIEETGGSKGLKDEGMLESALAAPFQSFDGKVLFPSVYQKAARLGYGLASNHAFVDGNKQIGMYVMLTFLEVNGIHMEASNEEVAQVGLAVAAGKMGYDELLDWVRAHRV